MAASDFTHVTFAEIPEVVSFLNPLECRYTVGDGLTPTARDWIGLYKLGWRLTKEYVWFEWSPLPGNYEPGATIENHVVFKAECLPRDTDEFYQFCYVANSGRVCGASPPFQFRETFDFVEVDETPSMLHIQPRGRAEARNGPYGNRTLDDLATSSNDGSLHSVELDAAKQQLREAELQLNSLRAEKQQLEIRLKGFQDSENEVAGFRLESAEVEESLREALRKKDEEVESLKQTLAGKSAELERSSRSLMELEQRYAEAEMRIVDYIRLCEDFSAAKLDWDRKEENYKRILQTQTVPGVNVVPGRIEGYPSGPASTGVPGDRRSGGEGAGLIPPAMPGGPGAPGAEAAGGVAAPPVGIRTCPYCLLDFPLTVPEADFAEHIATHEPKLCPICEKTFDPSYSQASFEAHVNECIVRMNP